MIAKTLVVLSVTLIVANAGPLNLEELLQALQQGNGREQIKNLFNAFLNNTSINQNAPGTQVDASLILSKLGRTLEDIGTQSQGLQVRGLFSISESIWLNELVKNGINFFLVHYQGVVGSLVLYPVRLLVDWLVNWLLPCGIQCTVLA